MKNRKKSEKIVGEALISSVLLFVGIKLALYFLAIAANRVLERVMTDD